MMGLAFTREVRAFPNMVYIRGLNMTRKKSIILVLALFLILVGIGIISMLSKNDSYQSELDWSKGSVKQSSPSATIEWDDFDEVYDKEDEGEVAGEITNNYQPQETYTPPKTTTPKTTKPKTITPTGPSKSYCNSSAFSLESAYNLSMVRAEETKVARLHDLSRDLERRGIVGGSYAQRQIDAIELLYEREIEGYLLTLESGLLRLKNEGC